jgi:hypothetical protein
MKLRGGFATLALQRQIVPQIIVERTAIRIQRQRRAMRRFRLRVLPAFVQQDSLERQKFPAGIRVCRGEGLQRCQRLRALVHFPQCFRDP